ncbi:MAG: TrbC/VirB2 family protein [Clostridia bacterium]|nr:TrbC/VirB2 family protein [Clostridia bacterium]
MLKVSKVISMLMIIMTIVSCASMVMAVGFNPTDIQASKGTADVGSINTIGNDIIRIIQAVGIVASVIVLAVLGIKYMMGSAEEKAEYKKTMIPYIVGAVLLFAASAFAQVIYNFASGISSTASVPSGNNVTP